MRLDKFVTVTLEAGLIDAELVTSNRQAASDPHRPTPDVVPLKRRRTVRLTHTHAEGIKGARER